MKNIFKKLTFMMGLFLLLGMWSGCQNQEVNAPQEPTLIIAQGVDATTLDPGMHAETPTGNIERQIFDTFLEQDAEMQVQPCIAKTWELKNDVTWAFSLRDDVFFHDGEQLTAQDVKFSLERILDPENKSVQAGNFNAIKEVKLIDDFNLEIITHQPYPFLLTRLSQLRIVPEHYILEVGDNAFALNPIGSGPYVLKEWIRDEHVTLNANKNYWRGIPEIKQVMFKPIPDQSARVMALQAGEADLIVNVPPHQVVELEKSAVTEIVSTPSTRFIEVAITTGNSTVRDTRVRQALNYAVDVQTLIDTILQGYGTESSQPVSQMDFGFHPGLEPYGFDPQRAKTLLKEAGYEDGLTLTMQSPSGRYLMDKEIAEAVKAQLEAVGINVQLSFPEWGVFIKDVINGTMTADLWLIGWGSSTFDVGTTLFHWIYSPNNFSYYDVDAATNAQLDALLMQSQQTMDNDKRAGMYHTILEQVQKDAAFINLYQQEDLYGISTRLNWQPRSDEAIMLRQMTWR